MKIQRIVFLLAAAFVTAGISHAQNPFVPTDAGTELRYVLEDASGKTIGYRTIKVESALETPRGLELKTSTINFDIDGKEIKDQPSMRFSILVTGEEVIYLKQGMIPALDMPENTRLVAEGDDVVYPILLNPGDTLPSGEITVSLLKKGEKKDKARKAVTIYSQERKALAKETVTVPAGTFDCIVVKEDLQFKAILGVVNQTQHSQKWFTPGIGSVINKQIGKKGEVVSVARLISVNKN